MAENSEYLLTTTRSNKSGCISLWDYHSENLLRSYKFNGCCTSIAQIGNDYIVASNSQKPLLHIWPINSQEQLKQFQLILPAAANSLAISHNNCYLACGIGTKLYVWQICSGILLSVQEKHIQTISNVKFSNDDNFLITTGEDGQLVAYNFGQLIDMKNSELEEVRPRYTRFDHSMKITDVHLGNFGLKSRLATVSLDHTCRIYLLATGQPILNLVFEEPLGSIIFDVFCWTLYVGQNSGLIKKVDLKSPPRTLEFHVDNPDSAKCAVFKGHAKCVTSLKLTINNSWLISGSNDCNVIIWDIISQQCIRKIEQDSEISQLYLIRNHNNLFCDNFQFQFVIKKLARTADFEDEMILSIRNVGKKCETESKGDLDTLNQSLIDTRDQLHKQKIINQQLFNYSKELLDKLYSKSDINNT